MAAESSPLQHWWQQARNRFRSWLQPPQTAFALAAATVLLLTLVLPKDPTPLENHVRAPEQNKPTEQTVLDAAAAYYKAVRTGELPLSYATNNPRELEDTLKISER